MKALSVKQPWANKITSGEKRIETRTWYTDYRGELLICSSKVPNIAPAGQALAIVDLIDCREMRPEDALGACCQFIPGLFSWVLSNIRRIQPFPVRGSYGIFEVNLISGQSFSAEGR